MRIKIAHMILTMVSAEDAQKSETRDRALRIAEQIIKDLKCNILPLIMQGNECYNPDCEFCNQMANEIISKIGG